MRKFSSILAIVLVVVMTFTMLAGCGGSKKDTNLKVFGIASGVTDEELNKAEVAQLIADHTGEKFEYYQAPSVAADAQTAIFNIFTNKLDYHSVMVTKQQFFTLLSQGALMDITSLVGATTNMKDVIGSIGWNMAKKDGKIYGIPNKDAMKSSAMGLAYRIDWLNAYNNDATYQKKVGATKIAVPAVENNFSMTTDNFKTYLTYVKDKGLVSDKPFRVDTNNVYQENILPAFGVYQEWADVNGTLTYAVNQPGFENYLAYMQDLYKNGLISYNADGGANGVKQITLKADGKYIEKPAAGVARVAHWNAAAIETGAGDDKIGYLSALVAKEGDEPYLFATEGYNYFTVIPKYVDKGTAERIVKAFDKKLEKDFFVKLVIGDEGTHYAIENDEYKPLLPKFNDRNIADKFTNGLREDDYAKYWQARVRKTNAQAKMFFSVNSKVDVCGIKSPIVVMPPNDIYDRYQGGRDTEIKTQLVKAMFGGKDALNISAIQALYNTGAIAGSDKTGAEITASVNEWYKNWITQNPTYNPKIK